ncbi:hypothetical protein IHQ71_01225 [Rhizobium sp. TH2]|uniref:hypothetical protein n=1 Tax=Rhizobium sp. TH2 TaxID=2775403 RepID=UPI0021571D77|nr:hypothetical protein [Rhizobium sp. TH2]UVC09281.1 hypothetical protein IHQ71_01225 [Rhizobium sp. TH2]
MLIRVLFAATFLALPIAAQADGRAEIRAKCQADVKANCGMVLSRDKAISCLIDNAAKLSGGCKTALEKASCSDQAPANLKAAFACKQ